MSIPVGYAVIGPDGKLLDIVPTQADAAALAIQHGLDFYLEDVPAFDDGVGGSALSGFEPDTTLGAGIENFPLSAAKATGLLRRGVDLSERSVMSMSLDEAHERLLPFFQGTRIRKKKGVPTEYNTAAAYSTPNKMGLLLFGQNYKTGKPADQPARDAIYKETHGKFSQGKTVGISFTPHVLPLGSEARSVSAPERAEYAKFNPLIMASDGNSVVAQDAGMITLCKGSTSECRAGCLVYSGQNMSDVYNIRVKFNRTKALLAQPVAMVRMMIHGIEKHVVRAKKAGFYPMIRLNVFSDIPWEYLLLDGGQSPQDSWFFKRFSRESGNFVQLYDYTKVAGRNEPSNYDLTFSYAGPKNGSVTRYEMDRGRRAAVVFVLADKFKAHKNTDFPANWNGFTVVDGDSSDMRPLDPKGVIVGLRWKMPHGAGGFGTGIKSAFTVKVWQIDGALVAAATARQEPIEDADAVDLDDGSADDGE